MASVAALALGCAAESDTSYDERLQEEIDLEPQASSFPDYPGNGDIAIHEGPNTQSTDCLIFDIVGSTDQPGTSSAHSGPADEAPIVMTFDDTTIRSPEGEVLCTRDGDALEGMRIRDGDTGDGPVLYTVLGRNVYEGELDLTGLSKKEMRFYLAERLLFAFRGTHVFSDLPGFGPPLATATEHIAFASSMRKLVMTALLDGECGSPGFP